jgi:hypothetical protein
MPVKKGTRKNSPKKSVSTNPPGKKRAKKLPVPGSAIHKSMVLSGKIKG